MRFPKIELDIDHYMQIIKNLLDSEDCHLFIDTNIILQLYKLNDEARADFLVGYQQGLVDSISLTGLYISIRRDMWVRRPKII